MISMNWPQAVFASIAVICATLIIIRSISAVERMDWNENELEESEPR